MPEWMTSFFKQFAVWILFGSLPDWSDWRSVQAFCKRNVRTLQWLATFTPWVIDDIALATLQSILNQDLVFQLWWSDIDSKMDQETINKDKDNETNRPILRALRQTLTNLRARTARS